MTDTLLRNAVMTATADAADIIHCHTWYTYMAGCLLKQILAAPLVVTTHSLEPHRPWKKDQLGDSYHATCRLEKTAMENADGIVAVSETIPLQDLPVLYSHAAVFVCPRYMNPSASSILRRVRAVHRWWLQRSGGFLKWWSMKKPGSWFL